MRPSANLDKSRYEYAFEKIKDLLPMLPSRAVFDIGPGDGRMKRVESLGVNWYGFDQNAWNGVSAWDMSGPYLSEVKAGAILLLDVREHCLSPASRLKTLPTPRCREGFWSSPPRIPGGAGAA